MGSEIAVQGIALPKTETAKQAKLLGLLVSGVLPTQAAKQAGYDAHAVTAYDISQLPGWKELCERARKSALSDLSDTAVQNLAHLMLHAERETVRLDATKTALALSGVAQQVQAGDIADMDALARQVLKTIDTLPDRAIPIEAETASAIDAAAGSVVSDAYAKRRGRPKKSSG